MAEPFKTFINAAGVNVAAGHLARTNAAFDAAAFSAAIVPRLGALELKARAMCVADALEQHLAADFLSAADHIERSLAPVGSKGNAEGLAGWILWPVGEFVARQGLLQPERALTCLRAITQRFTAEFAIRPFLVHHPQLVFATMRREWVHHESEHVRRLVSEGTRPRLPWGAQLKSLIADPSPSLPLLEALQDDGSEYVRRSVANHLNDIAKDHPSVLVEWLERHLPGASPERAALLRHASRTLIKQGHPRVLAAWGRGSALEGHASLELGPRQLTFGSAVTLALTISSRSARAQSLTIDYVVHHVKADGRTSPKVFKGWNAVVAPGATVTLTKRHSVKPITTRRYYPGTHRVVIQANGQPVAEAAFDLLMDGANG
jgi:3-methyladenine DNA glycosylase AlkC